MAALTQCSDKSKQVVAKKSTEDNQRKVSKKNILLPPFQLSWPEVNGDVENKVLTALTANLEQFPRLEEERKRGGVGAGRERTADTDGDDLIRARIRQQLMVGHRQVTKGLERGLLDLVLVWAGTQPPLLLRSLLPLAASRACPALCLRALVPRVTEATGLTSLVALGFKKPAPGLSDFADFIALASPLAPPLAVPGVSLRITSAKSEKGEGETEGAAGDGEEDMDKKENSVVVEEDDGGDNEGDDDPDPEAKQDTQTKPSQAVTEWPVMSADDETQLLQKLTDILTPYKSVFKKPKPRFTSKEWKDQRKTIRSHMLTDVVALSDAAKSRRLDLLLVQQDVNFPNLTLTSVITMAVKRGCPVLHLSKLQKVMSPILRNPLLKAVGLKKAKEAKVEQLPEFREFITFASQFVPADLGSHLGADDVSGSKGKEEDEKDKVTSRPKKPVPFYDVSHLYVYKTDLKKMESEKQTDGKKRTALSVKTESFISLSSEPTVQLLGTGHSDKDTADITNTKSLSLDTEGSSKTVQPETSTTAKDKDSSADTNGGGPLVGVMGLDVTDAPGVGGPARGRGSAAKGRGGVKRKHTSRAKQWELTFTLAPTNVQTSVSNPSKKKKARKNKKKKNN